jgi:hypothetical protein
MVKPMKSCSLWYKVYAVTPYERLKVPLPAAPVGTLDAALCPVNLSLDQQLNRKLMARDDPQASPSQKLCKTVMFVAREHYELAASRHG